MRGREIGMTRGGGRGGRMFVNPNLVPVGTAARPPSAGFPNNRTGAVPYERPTSTLQCATPQCANKTTDHRTQDCPNRPCMTCKQIGHTRAQCPYNQAAAIANLAMHQQMQMAQLYYEESTYRL